MRGTAAAGLCSGGLGGTTSMTRPASTPSLLERRLSAFIDGQSSDEERQDIEALLVNDPQARSLHDSLRRGAGNGRRLFDEMLKEPVPLHLGRGIRNAEVPRKAVRLPDSAPAGFAFKPPARGTVAGCALMLVVGLGLGYMFGMQPSNLSGSSQLAGASSQTRDWLDDIIAHYRLYGRQQNRLVEIGNDRAADILEWLTTGTGVSFRIPDLGDSGLSFLGARLISAEGMPTGILFYRRTTEEAEGDILAVTFSKATLQTSKPVEDIRLDTGLVSWSTPLATYVLVGPSSAADLDEIAAKAAGLI